MRQSYIDVIHEYCSETVIVFDKFHIVRHLIEAVDKIRRTEAKPSVKWALKCLKVADTYGRKTLGV